MAITAHLVAPDIYQARIPLPYQLNHVFCYLLRDGSGWTIVDTGLNWPEAQAAWFAYFEQLGINPKEDIRKIILTHMHPDHFGMAGWFQSQSGAPIYISERELHTVHYIWYAWAAREVNMRHYFQKCGLPENLVETAIQAGNSTAALTAPLPKQIEPLPADGQIVIGDRTFSVITAPGHSDGQALFYHAPEELLLSGDHVLLKITPNIGLWPESDPAPLARYLASLDALCDLPVKLALPGHKSVIHNWQARINELQAHHAQRLALLHEKSARGITVFQAAGEIFDLSRLTQHEIRFALAETLAHLEYLGDTGALQREDGDVYFFKG